MEGLPRFTSNTLTTKSALIEELKTVKELGYTFDREECEPGAKCVAVPVYNEKGKIFAGISITGSKYRLTDEFINSK